MRLDRFDLNRLVVFEAVYTEQNLTRAAEKLNLAQPTISNAMTRLRTAFDDPLFIRSGRGVAPTPLARKIIDPIRQSLRQVQATLDQNLTFDPSKSDAEFNISMGEITATVLLPTIVEAISAEAPHVMVRAFQTDRREIKEKLALGQLDIALDISRLSARELNSADLPTGSYVCAMSRGHPGAKNALTPETMLNLDFIAVSSRSTGSSLLELAMQKIGHRVRPKMRTQYYLPAMRIVESSSYAVIAPESIVAEFDVVSKPLPFPIGVEGNSIYWHRSVEEDPANRWLRSKVLQAARAPGGDSS